MDTNRNERVIDKMARDIRVAFKLAEDRKELLQNYADSYGVTMSALCAFVIGQWLYQQENVAKPIFESVSEIVREAIRKELESGKAVEMLQGALAETTRK